MKTKIETIKKFIESLKDEYYSLKDDQTYYENEITASVESGCIIAADEAFQNASEIYKKCESVKRAINALGKVCSSFSGEQYRVFLG